MDRSNNSRRDTAGVIENVLAHHGVKGMRWGVRRTDAQLATAVKVVSEDVQRSAATKEKIKTHGTQALSNKELQDLLTRMNLDQQYSRMVSEQSDKIGRAKKYVNNANFVGKTVNDAIAFSKSPAGLLIRKTLVGV